MHPCIHLFFLGDGAAIASVYNYLADLTCRSRNSNRLKRRTRTMPKLHNSKKKRKKNGGGSWSQKHGGVLIKCRCAGVGNNVARIEDVARFLSSRVRVCLLSSVFRSHAHSPPPRYKGLYGLRAQAACAMEGDLFSYSPPTSCTSRGRNNAFGAHALPNGTPAVRHRTCDKPGNV